MDNDRGSVIAKHVEMLGYEVTDKVTKFDGVVTSVAFDLYGCIQCLVSPKAKPGDSELKYGHWFDALRLKKKAKKAVMEVPDFHQGYVAEGRRGAAIKPVQL